MSTAIFGIETETSLTGAGKRVLSPGLLADAARYYFASIAAAWGSSNAYLGNGARLYLDVGSHPEYATPECSTLRELVATVKAGERRLEALAATAAERLAAAALPGVTVIANNRDSSGNVYGCHENYLVGRNAPGVSDTMFGDIGTHVMAFLVSRQILCGSGLVDQTTAAGTYRMTQRYDVFSETVGAGTTRNRAVISTRDEAHGGPGDRRLHIIVGDTNMSEWSTFLKVGSTQLVLDMIAAGVDLRAMQIVDPVAAQATYSGDPECRTTMPGAVGRDLTAVDVQRGYLQAAELHFATHSSSLDPGESAEVLGMWREAVDALDSHNLGTIIDRLGDRVDWVIKYSLLRDYMEKHDLTLSSPRVRQIDINYHRLDDERGLYNLLSRHGRVRRMVETADIDALIDAPPATTRSRLRGAFIAAARLAGWSTSGTDWVHFKATAPDGVETRAITVTDPRATTDSRVSDAIEMFEATAAQKATARVAPPRPQMYEQLGGL